MPEPAAIAADTKTSLLDAAERLFAEHGIAGASLRAITGEAAANLAAVHYHFGSKEGLVRAVFARRLEPLNRQRLELLAEAPAGDAAAEVERIITAFVAPPLRMIDREPGGRAFAQLLARALLEPGAGSRELVLEQFEEIIERFTEALARALPALGRDEAIWRFHFMVGSLSFTAGLGFLVEHRTGVPTDGNAEVVIARLVAFLTGGMERAPAGDGRGR